MHICWPHLEHGQVGEHVLEGRQHHVRLGQLLWGSRTGGKHSNITTSFLPLLTHGTS